MTQLVKRLPHKEENLTSAFTWKKTSTAVCFYHPRAGQQERGGFLNSQSVLIDELQV